MTLKELKSYERKTDTESAINLLLLIGPEKFHGNYEDVLTALIAKDDKIQDITREIREITAEWVTRVEKLQKELYRVKRG